MPENPDDLSARGQGFKTVQHNTSHCTSLSKGSGAGAYSLYMAGSTVSGSSLISTENRS